MVDGGEGEGGRLIDPLERDKTVKGKQGKQMKQRD